MVNRIAAIRNNIIENVLIIDGDWSWYTQDGCEIVNVTNISVGPGWTRNEDGTFSSPPDKQPEDGTFSSPPDNQPIE